MTRETQNQMQDVLTESKVLLDEIQSLEKVVPPWIIRRVKKIEENLTWIENQF